MSLLLFGLAEDFLSHYLSHLVQINSIVPMSSLRNQYGPTHLLYANVVLLFCKGKVSNLKNLTAAFSIYGVFQVNKLIGPNLLFILAMLFLSLVVRFFLISLTCELVRFLLIIWGAFISRLLHSCCPSTFG